MKKTLKKSLAFILSLMMIISVSSVAAVSADTEYTMIAIVAMKPQEGDELLATRHIFNITEAEVTALNGGTPVALSDFGFEADWGIAASEAYGDYHAGNWDQSSWGYDANGHLYFETHFPLAGGSTPAEEYAAAGRGEVKGFIRDVDSEPKDGIVHDSNNRAYIPDLKANETFEGNDTVRLVLTTEEVYYAPAPVTEKEIQLTNADSADGWWVFDGDTFSIDTEIKSEGTGSIKYPHTGGVAWGATFEGKDLTGIKSISFDIAADNAGILTEPTDKCFLLMSDNVMEGFHEPFNGEAFLSNADAMKKIMQFDVSVFDTNKDEYTLTPDSKTFKTVTLTPSVVGEEFNYKNVTNFMHWSCTGYGGDHTEWMDNVRVTVEVPDTETDKVLKAELDGTGENHLSYLRLAQLSTTIQDGDYLEYDVCIDDDLAGVGALDVCSGDDKNCRDEQAVFVDQNGIPGHPASDISDYAHGKWYSRKLKLSQYVAGTSDSYIVIAFENLSGKTTVYYDNIRITRNGEVVEYAFEDGGDEYRYIGTNYAGDEGKITVTKVSKSTVNAAEEAKEYVTFKTWGTDEFNAAVSADTAEPGDTLTTGASGVYTVYSRPATYGTSSAGVVGYASYGKTFMAYKDHEYTYEFDFWVNDIAEDEKGEVLFYGDLYNQETVDDATVNTYFTKGITYNDFAAEETIHYNEEFGYAYKTLADTLVAEEDGNSESRWYYNRLNVRNQGERDSYAVGDVSFYECRIYDDTVDPFNPIMVLNPGEDQMAGFSNETNPNTANPREMDVLSVTKSALVSLPKAKNCDNTLLFGNAAADLKAGSYVVKYELSDIVVAGEGTLATVKVMNGANEVASKDITAADLDLTAKTNVIEVPFDVAADGKYSAELYINNKMGFSLNSIAMGVEIDPDDIAKVVEKINAIGEVQYDPDENLDNGALITDARKAYDDLCQKYNGMDMSDYVDNFTMLTSAESLYAGKVAEYKEMLDSAKIVDDSIASIPLPVTLESGEYIVAAEQAFAEFINSYTQKKADLHITKANDLKAAREAYDLLLQVKYGDVDASGTVEATDALWALQAYVGLRQLDDTQFKAADVNLDEKVDTSDALAILQFAVQLRTELPVKN